MPKVSTSHKKSGNGAVFVGIADGAEKSLAVDNTFILLDFSSADGVTDKQFVQHRIFDFW